MNKQQKVVHSSDSGLHAVAVYNPSLWNDDELTKYFVARRDVLEKITKRLASQQPDLPAQHQLIIGQRGMGKSTLLQRISLAIRQNDELNGIWMPLSFPEEQYNVKNLKDLWLNTLDAIGDSLEGQGCHQQADELDELIDKVKNQPEAQVLEAVIGVSDKLKKRLLLLIDNIDLVFERVKEQHWHLREILQSAPQVTFIGASANVIEATYNYDAAFYDFFQVIPLKPLTRIETNQVLFNLSHAHNVPIVQDILKSDPSRIHTLHTLTGGNPRTVVLLFKVLAQGLDGDVRSDLEGLLDIVTPLYKARFEELSVAGQQIVDVIALNWDPISANGVAEKLNIDVNKASSLINRLVNSGVVEKVAPASGKRLSFQINERFFNIWYLMRASRRVRKKLIWLVYFLKMFFTAKELEQHAQARLQTAPCNEVREAEFNLALAQTVANDTRHALEHSTLFGLYRHHSHHIVDGMFDLEGEDRAFKSVAERIKWLEQSRSDLIEVLTSRNDLSFFSNSEASREANRKANKEINSEIENKVEAVLSAPFSVKYKQHFIEVLKTAPANRVEGVFNEIQSRKVEMDYIDSDVREVLCQSFRQGIILSIADIAGAKVAAKRFEQPKLLYLVALWYLFAGSEGDDDKAELEEICLAALKDTEQFPLSHLLMAYYCYRYDRAKLDEYLALAKPHGSETPYYWYLKLLIAENNSSTDELLQYAKLLTTKFPDFAGGWYALVHIHDVYLHQPQQAIDSYKQAIALISEWYAGYWHIAFIYHYQLNELDKALDYYQQATERIGADSLVYFGLADVLQQLGQYQGAQQALKTAQQKAQAELSDLLWFCHQLSYRSCYQQSFTYLVFLVGLCDDHHAEQLTNSWPSIIRLVKRLLPHIDKQEFADSISQASDAIFWRALQYALKAFAAQDSKIFNALAPELRAPAQDILAQLQS